MQLHRIRPHLIEIRSNVVTFDRNWIKCHHICSKFGSEKQPSLTNSTNLRVHSTYYFFDQMVLYLNLVTLTLSHDRSKAAYVGPDELST